VAIASVIIGIIALFAWLIPILGFPISGMGLILGIVALVNNPFNKRWVKGMAIAGISLCTLGLIGSIINRPILSLLNWI